MLKPNNKKTQATLPVLLILKFIRIIMNNSVHHALKKLHRRYLYS